jgi:hypothetical protein
MDKIISGLSQDALIGCSLAYFVMFWFSYSFFQLGFFLAIMAIPTALWVYVFYKVDRKKKMVMAYALSLAIIGILAFAAMGR